MGPDLGLGLSVCLSITASVCWVFPVASQRGQSWEQRETKSGPALRPALSTRGPALRHGRCRVGVVERGSAANEEAEG